MEVFRKSLDFLDLRLVSNSVYLEPFYGLSDNSRHLFLDHGFYAFFDYQTENKKIIWIKDKYNIPVCYINLLIKKVSKRSLGSYIQFVGYFFHCYSEYLDYFLEVFNFDLLAPDRVRRFDFCFDFYGSTKEMKTFLFSTKGHITDYSYDGEYSGCKIYIGDNKDNKSHEIGLYDKKLDTLRKGKYKWDIPDNPFLLELHYEGYISRLECRFFARSLKELQDNSLSRILKDCETLSFQYLSRFFILPFSCNFSYSRRDKKKDIRIDRICDKKLSLYENMSFSYLDNVRFLASEKYMFDLIIKKFPNISEYILGAIIQKSDDLPPP